MSDDTRITGRDLIALGFEPAPWFGQALEEINARQLSRSQAAQVAQRFVDEIAAAEAARRARELPLRAAAPDFVFNLTEDEGTEDERANIAAVRETFTS